MSEQELVLMQPNDLLITSPSSLLSIQNLTHVLEICERLSKTDMIPKQYKGKPDDILVCMEYGRSIGLGSLQSLQSICVINGVPTVWGDALLAIAQQHPTYEWIKENALIKDGQVAGYDCTIKRKNHEPSVARFTVEDAKVAKLWGKVGPWTQYPKRMLMWRARSFAIRNVFADALRGVKDRDEVQDYGEIDITPKKEKNQDAENVIKGIG